jgi:hypothetical protein
MILIVTGILAAIGLTATAGSAAAIPGLVNVSAASAFNSNVFKGVTVPCPAGHVVIGGGARLSLTTGEVSITRMAPNAAGTAYEAWAYEDVDGFAFNWALIVTAICAPAPPGYAIVTAASPMGSPPTATIAVNCPAGSQVFGTGGWAFPGRGVTLLTGIIPFGAGSGVVAHGAEIPGFAGPWNVQAWAICAAPVPVYNIATASTLFDSMTPKNQTAVCPAGTSVHGVGFDIAGGPGEIFLNMAFPNPMAPVGTSVPVVASEDQTLFAGNWGFRVFAICAA